MKFFLTLLSLCISVISLAQNKDVGYQQMLRNEARSYQKMSSYNVNSNTLNYDLKYTRCEFNLDPAVYNVSGTLTHHFLPNQSLNSIYFDLANVLTVASVNYHGNTLNFQQLSTDELKIDFSNILPANTLDSLSISYSGVPPSVNSAFNTSTQSGTPLLWTLSEPYGAKDWWPTKQSMIDKIEKMDIKVTTPSQYNVASNGKLISETVLPNGNKLTYWQTNYPIAAYLFALGITNYVKNATTINSMGTPIPFLNYLYPNTNTNSTVQSNIAWTTQVMALYESKFGAYPFRNEKYGHAQFGYGGGMEHQTMSFMGNWSQGVICHELAHQWFGDKVTCSTWNDIWLNEGFATFGEHVTNENLLMDYNAFMSYLGDQMDYITSSPDGSVYVSDSKLAFDGNIFNGRLSYSKGGYLLRMLKWILGDDKFYQAVKNYLNDPALAYGYANSSNLKYHLENISGLDLTEFFNDWLYGQGYPTYTIRWKQSDSNLAIKADQIQSDPSVSFFELPLPIRIHGTNGEVLDVALNNTTNNQYFYNTINFTVSSVEFNYDKQIITKDSTVINDNTLEVNNPNQNNKVTLYPNPVKNQLFLSGLKQNINYQIYNTEGRLITSALLSSSSFIDVSALNKGNYILKSSVGNFHFIKQ